MSQALPHHLIEKQHKGAIQSTGRREKLWTAVGGVEDRFPALRDQSRTSAFGGTPPEADPWDSAAAERSLAETRLDAEFGQVLRIRCLTGKRKLRAKIVHLVVVS